MTTVALHVGTYAEARGQGLHRVNYDPATGFTLREPYPAAANASFGAWSSRHGLHYLVNEQAAGMLGIYRCQSDGWTQLAQVSSEGREPCYVTLDPDERHVAIANYGSGSLALLELTPDGLPSGEVSVWTNAGDGPNPDRQEAPHIHCVRFSQHGRSLYAVDLGTDQILRFAMDGPVRLQSPEVAWQAPAGSGPRHLIFHPTQPLALVVSELASTLTLLDAVAPQLRLLGRHSTLPVGFEGESLGGHLELNRAGDRVYATNRGHNSIALFGLDPAAGAIHPIQHIASEGASPRFFLLLEDIDRLILVNEEAGNLVAFAIENDGRLVPTGHTVDVAGAAFLMRE